MNDVEQVVMEEYATDFESRRLRASRSLARIEEKIARTNRILSEEQDNLEERISDALTDDILEEFVDSVLSTMVTLSDKGFFPEVESAAEARMALLAVVRKMYLRKSVLATMSSKFARYGAERLLRSQRTKISKSI